MSRIFKVLLPSCWLLVFSCSSGSGSRVSPIDAFSGEPDVPTAAGGATDTSAPGTGGAQETADLAGAGDGTEGQIFRVRQVEAATLAVQELSERRDRVDPGRWLRNDDTLHQVAPESEYYHFRLYCLQY